MIFMIQLSIILLNIMSFICTNTPLHDNSIPQNTNKRINHGNTFSSPIITDMFDMIIQSYDSNILDIFIRLKVAYDKEDYNYCIVYLQVCKCLKKQFAAIMNNQEDITEKTEETNTYPVILDLIFILIEPLINKFPEEEPRTVEVESKIIFQSIRWLKNVKINYIDQEYRLELDFLKCIINKYKNDLYAKMNLVQFSGDEIKHFIKTLFIMTVKRINMEYMNNKKYAFENIYIGKIQFIKTYLRNNCIFTLITYPNYLHELKMKGDYEHLKDNIYDQNFKTINTCSYMIGENKRNTTKIISDEVINIQNEKIIYILNFCLRLVDSTFLETKVNLFDFEYGTDCHKGVLEYTNFCNLLDILDDILIKEKNNIKIKDYSHLKGVINEARLDYENFYWINRTEFVLNLLFQFNNLELRESYQPINKYHTLDTNQCCNYNSIDTTFIDNSIMGKDRAINNMPDNIKNKPLLKRKNNKREFFFEPNDQTTSMLPIKKIESFINLNGARYNYLTIEDSNEYFIKEGPDIFAICKHEMSENVKKKFDKQVKCSKKHNRNIYIEKINPKECASSSKIYQMDCAKLEFLAESTYKNKTMKFPYKDDIAQSHMSVSKLTTTKFKCHPKPYSIYLSLTDFDQKELYKCVLYIEDALKKEAVINQENLFTGTQAFRVWYGIVKKMKEIATIIDYKSNDIFLFNSKPMFNQAYYIFSLTIDNKFRSDYLAFINKLATNTELLTIKTKASIIYIRYKSNKIQIYSYFRYENIAEFIINIMEKCATLRRKFDICKLYYKEYNHHSLINHIDNLKKFIEAKNPSKGVIRIQTQILIDNMNHFFRIHCILFLTKHVNNYLAVIYNTIDLLYDNKSTNVEILGLQTLVYVYNQLFAHVNILNNLIKVVNEYKVEKISKRDICKLEVKLKSSPRKKKHLIN